MMEITKSKHIGFQIKKEIEDVINKTLWENYLKDVPESDRVFISFEEYKETFTIKAVYEEKKLYIELKQLLN